MILDGAMGTMIQKYNLTEEDYRCEIFSGCQKDLKGNNECLNLTHPEIIKAIHEEYIAAGADIIETNTFSANRISQAEYGCEDFALQMAYEGARIAREAADSANSSRPCERKVLVAGSMGPTSKSLSLSPEVSDPAFRTHSFDQMKEAYREQAEALLRAGADILLIETCFDALNVKAALSAIQDVDRETLMPRPTLTTGITPVMISVSVGDRSGRTLTGQTLEAFHTAVRHYPIVSFGLNCSLGAAELTPLIEEVAGFCDCALSCYPNAGLPNELGGYDQSPDEMAAAIRNMASKGLIDIAGGCCGTTPAHIKAIAEVLKDVRPRGLSTRSGSFVEKQLKVSGLEAVTIDVKQSNFINVGERTNVAGSRKFARLISEGKYDEALQIAAKQIEDGASVIDINMDDAMLDSAREMERFVRYISNDPAVAKAALMIDSSHWETILAGLTNAQGKCIVNSISLKEGEDEFIRKAQAIRSLGAAMVVMAFDEEGQATTFERKIEICRRAYSLLTEKAGVSPEDIIFDVNILSIGTGIEEHAKYGVDFIEAVRWIKANLPGALTSGGVSNLSFAFRGNNAVREAMHSAFLYHAIKAGLDMAIVNPSMLQVYDEIEPELLKCVEDVIFDKDPQATERLIEKASRMMAAKEAAAENSSRTAPVNMQSAEPLEKRLTDALVKGRSETLEKDLMEALEKYGKPVSIIEGPLMEGMETVGRLFGEGKMFLPQVVKSAKIMKDAVDILNPYMGHEGRCTEDPLPPCGPRPVLLPQAARCKSPLDYLPSRSRPLRGGAMSSTQSTLMTEKSEHIHFDRNADRNTDRNADCSQNIVLATVKGDVHDIGKNILGIVLSCNGFEVKDLGVMVDKETILDEAQKGNADIIAVSGLITPSLYQMEELCREMAARNMTTPLFVGGATTSALHTAVKLAPHYSHVFHGADASASAVMAKKCMMDRDAFEKEQHEEQEKLRALYAEGQQKSKDTEMTSTEERRIGFADETYLTVKPSDIPLRQLKTDEVMPYFDWKMFYAIWGVKYGSAVPEVTELMQLKADAEDEILAGRFRIMVSCRFMEGCSDGESIIMENGRIPMMRQEGGQGLSLCDFVINQYSGRRSPFGVFAVSVQAADVHVAGCSCPACNNRYEDMVGRTVRQTLAEAASEWMGHVIREKILHYVQNDNMKNAELQNDNMKNDELQNDKPKNDLNDKPKNDLNDNLNANSIKNDDIKIIRPAAGYASCPDHTLKKDILELLGEHVHVCNDDCCHGHGHGNEHGSDGLGISMTDSYAMMPEASICGMIFMHPEARYPDIRRIGKEQYERYAESRGMDKETARRFLGHLL